jgi:hypothetical protein
MLSGKFGIKEDEKGNIFIDRDGTHFKFILNYLREKGAEDEIVLPEDPVILKELKKEFKYYQIPFPVVSLVNEDSWEKIAEWTGYKGEWELFYKATRDGFRNEDYKSKVKDFKDTLSIVQSSNGNVFGSYKETKDDESFKNFEFSFVNFMGGKFSINNYMNRYIHASNNFVFSSHIVISNKSNSNLSSNCSLDCVLSTKNMSNEFYFAGAIYFTTKEIEVYKKLT